MVLVLGPAELGLLIAHRGRRLARGSAGPTAICSMSEGCTRLSPKISTMRGGPFGAVQAGSVLIVQYSGPFATFGGAVREL
jgi:hypothetical protein